MGKYSEIGLYKPIYELYRLTQQFVAKMDRAYRFSLGGKLVDSLNEIIKLTSLANNSLRNKESYLADALSTLEIAKIQFRVANDLKLISTGSYALVIRHLDSIGKQINGWYSSVRK